MSKEQPIEKNAPPGGKPEDIPEDQIPTDTPPND